ncbi:hypothetical protein L1987_63993 [Smallanthus sonchifolius]|uniref:Uncharacterized protein n=1 Tax=Smallanthus sonchifolius TaxID=185202 RepID=A0ACB9CF35_9ASTR|nr:hypothetical protein L1987_63993 [Smallanthus sonchifolius]
MNPSSGLLPPPKHPTDKSKEESPSIAADGGANAREGLPMDDTGEANSSLPYPPVVSSGPISVPMEDTTSPESLGVRDVGSPANPAVVMTPPPQVVNPASVQLGPMEIDNPPVVAAKPVPTGPIVSTQPQIPSVVSVTSTQVWSYTEMCKGSSSPAGLKLQYVPPVITPEGTSMDYNVNSCIKKAVEVV